MSMISEYMGRHTPSWLKQAFAVSFAAKPGPSPMVPLLSGPVDYELPAAAFQAKPLPAKAVIVKAEPPPYTAKQLRNAIKANEEYNQMIWGDPSLLHREEARAMSSAYSTPARSRDVKMTTAIEHSIRCQLVL